MNDLSTLIIFVPEILNQDNVIDTVDSIFEQNSNYWYIAFQLEFYGGEVTTVVVEHPDSVGNFDLWMGMQDKITWEFYEDTIWEEKFELPWDYWAIVPNISSKEPLKFLQELCSCT